MSVLKLRKCPTCQGHGTCDDLLCPTCEGTGEISYDEKVVEEPCR